MNQTNTNQVGDLPQGLAVASMVAGILSLLGCSMFAAIPAIVCGHIGVRQADRGEASGKGTPTDLPSGYPHPSFH